MPELLSPAIALAAALCIGCAPADFTFANAEGDDSSSSLPDDAGGEIATSDSMWEEISPSSSDSTTRDSSSSATDAREDSSADTAPLDTGCPLHDHYEPMNGTKWRSCLHSGVYGDPATYPPTLIDEELAHVDASTIAGCSWGPRTSIVCEGITCIERSYACPAIFSGMAWSTWCAAGSLAGAYTGSSSPTCPTKDSHGTWY